jgi:uncharacterized membrane protein YfcA
MSILSWIVIGLAGLSMGATSLGGVLVAPALHALRGEPLAAAVAASSFAFLLTGLLALAQSGESVLERMKADAPLHVSALLGAGAGAALTAWTPESWIRLWIGAIALASGFHTLWTLQRGHHNPDPSAPDRWPEAGELAWIGLTVGVGSALSGTGGPMLLLPWLMARSCPINRLIACALAIQVPIAISATASHLVAGRLDLGLGLGVAAVLVPCAWLGRKAARRAPSRLLRQSAATLLVLAGLWLLID